jgi:hypothetical protein
LRELVSIVWRAMSEPKNRVRAAPNADLEGMPLVGRSPAMQEIFVPLRMDEKSLQIGDMAVHGEEAFPESSVRETRPSHVWPTRASPIVGTYHSL